MATKTKDQHIEVVNELDQADSAPWHKVIRDVVERLEKSSYPHYPHDPSNQLDIHTPIDGESPIPSLFLKASDPQLPPPPTTDGLFRDHLTPLTPQDPPRATPSPVPVPTPPERSGANQGPLGVQPQVPISSSHPVAGQVADQYRRAQEYGLTPPAGFDPVAVQRRIADQARAQPQAGPVPTDLMNSIRQNLQTTAGKPGDPSSPRIYPEEQNPSMGDSVIQNLYDYTPLKPIVNTALRANQLAGQAFRSMAHDAYNSSGYQAPVPESERPRLSIAGIPDPTNPNPNPQDASPNTLPTQPLSVALDTAAGLTAPLAAASGPAAMLGGTLGSAAGATGVDQSNLSPETREVVKPLAALGGGLAGGGLGAAMSRPSAGTYARTNKAVTSETAAQETAQPAASGVGMSQNVTKSPIRDASPYASTAEGVTSNPVAQSAIGAENPASLLSRVRNAVPNVLDPTRLLTDPLRKAHPYLGRAVDTALWLPRTTSGVNLVRPLSNNATNFERGMAPFGPAMAGVLTGPDRQTMPGGQDPVHPMLRPYLNLATAGSQAIGHNLTGTPDPLGAAKTLGQKALQSIPDAVGPGSPLNEADRRAGTALHQYGPVGAVGAGLQSLTDSLKEKLDVPSVELKSIASHLRDVNHVPTPEEQAAVEQQQKTLTADQVERAARRQATSPDSPEHQYSLLGNLWPGANSPEARQARAEAPVANLSPQEATRNLQEADRQIQQASSSGDPEAVRDWTAWREKLRQHHPELKPIRDQYAWKPEDFKLQDPRQLNTLLSNLKTETGETLDRALDKSKEVLAQHPGREAPAGSPEALNYEAAQQNHNRLVERADQHLLETYRDTTLKTDRQRLPAIRSELEALTDKISKGEAGPEALEQLKTESQGIADRQLKYAVRQFSTQQGADRDTSMADFREALRNDQSVKGQLEVAAHRQLAQAAGSGNLVNKAQTESLLGHMDDTSKMLLYGGLGLAAIATLGSVLGFGGGWMPLLAVMGLVGGALGMSGKSQQLFNGQAGVQDVFKSLWGNVSGLGAKWNQKPEDRYRESLGNIRPAVSLQDLQATSSGQQLLQHGGTADQISQSILSLKPEDRPAALQQLQRVADPAQLQAAQQHLKAVETLQSGAAQMSRLAQQLGVEPGLIQQAKTDRTAGLQLINSAARGLERNPAGIGQALKSLPPAERQQYANTIRQHGPYIARQTNLTPQQLEALATALTGQ